MQKKCQKSRQSRESEGTAVDVYMYIWMDEWASVSDQWSYPYLSETRPHMMEPNSIPNMDVVVATEKAEVSERRVPAARESESENSGCKAGKQTAST